MCTVCMCAYHMADLHLQLDARGLRRHEDLLAADLGRQVSEGL